MNSKAKWIELDTSRIENEEGALCPEFRREFDLETVPAKAALSICGLGFFDARINGKPVTDHLLTPPFTVYDKRVYFEEYDVSALLQPGKNELTVRLGSGWYNETSANAWEFEHATWHSCLKMIAGLQADGECILVSDRSWDARVSNTLFSQLREGETYDAGAAEQPWYPARISRGPGGILEKYEGPAVRVEEIVEPVKMMAVGEKILCDFGANLAGNCEITAVGPRGSRVRMVYGERIDENNELDCGNIGMFVKSDRFQTDEFILAGEGEETWHSLFNYNGFRYVMVSGDAKMVSIRARSFHTELPVKGGFECDNDVLNAIQDAILRSTKTNFHHMPTDCPHREKNGWTGDAHLSAEQALVNLDAAPAYRKWMRDFHDVQRPNGMLPGIIPTSSWGYNWGNGVSWDCACVEIPWQSYMATGDDSFLRENFGLMEKYVDYMTNVADEHISTIGLGDWCSPDEAKPMNTPALLTAISIRVYRLMEKICAVTGLGCPEKYAALAEETKKAFKAHFTGDVPADAPFGPVQDSQTYLAMLLWFGLADDAADVTARLVKEIAEADNHLLCGIFGTKFILEALTDNGQFDLAEETQKAFKAHFTGDVPADAPFGPVQDSQTYLAMLLWFGLADDAADVTARLVKEIAEADNHLLCGIFGTKFILEALTDNGQFDLAYEIAVQKDYPGWYHMLSNGSGTLWEDWEGCNSLNHHMYSTIGAWFYKGIAGIRVEEAGYGKVRIQPHVPKDMKYFKAWHDAPMGRLEVLWKDGTLTVTAPEAMNVVMDTDLSFELIRA